ncbi:glycosyltransferase [Sinomicrobium oceani]|uniref:glycosyltransferase n=1 Tax=Sinomicrobium oceani TaxID=1150368 RepID=UPI002279F499|nr:glycosyltransferase [Sinomicrobium oceani]
MQNKVCFFIGSMALGGIGKLTLHLMEEFVKKGILVDLFLMKDGGEYMEQIPKEVRIFIEEGSYFKRIYKFVVYLNREKPMVSISARQRQDLVNIFGCMMSFNKTQPVISIHTNVSVENKQKANSRNNNVYVVILSKWLYKIPKKFIAVSKGVADDFTKRTGIKRANIKVIYNPVYKPYTEVPKLQQTLPIYEQLISEKNKRYIIGVGRLTQQKDFFTLIKAFKIVRQKVDVVLIILGEGPLRKDLEKLIVKLNLEKYIFLLGFVNNPQYYIKRADLFVLSSKWEGFGNVIVESLGVGTPVVSTDCPSGPREILEDGKYGRLVSVENPSEMAAAIIDTLSKSKDSDLLVNRAKDFSSEKIAEEYLQYIFESKL